MNTQDAAKGVQRGFAQAHEKICSKEGIKASTQLLGGIFVALVKKENEEKKWAFIACGVGHCKAFMLHKAGSVVVDITRDNYLYNYDVPQGAIGPVNGMSPNLENMRLFFRICDPQDVLILTTQGIHNNCHPQHVSDICLMLICEIVIWMVLVGLYSFKIEVSRQSMERY